MCKHNKAVKFKCPNAKKLGHKQNRYSELLDLGILDGKKSDVIGYQCEYVNCGYYEFKEDPEAVGVYGR